jgi:hypothetical protein
VRALLDAPGYAVEHPIVAAYPQRDDAEAQDVMQDIRRPLRGFPKVRQAHAALRKHLYAM